MKPASEKWAVPAPGSALRLSRNRALRLGASFCTALLLLAVFPTAVAAGDPDEEERMQRVAARVLAALEGKVSPRSLATEERKVLQRARSVSFDPFPAAPHRVHLDRVEDYRERRVLRTRFDYAGNAISSSEPVVDRSLVENYLLALAYETLGLDPPPGLPAVVAESGDG